MLSTWNVARTSNLTPVKTPLANRVVVSGSGISHPISHQHQEAARNPFFGEYKELLAAERKEQAYGRGDRKPVRQACICRAIRVGGAQELGDLRYPLENQHFTLNGIQTQFPRHCPKFSRFPLIFARRARLKQRRAAGLAPGRKS